MAQPIAVSLGRLAQLFDTLEPAPFGGRSLDQRVEQYLLSAARQLPAREAVEVIVELPESVREEPLADEIVPAIRDHFAGLYAAETSALRELTQDGRRALIIGVTILATCLFLIFVVETYLPYPTLARLAEDSLIILGWVAMWGPFDILLFERRPLIRQRRLFRRLADAAVVVRSCDGTAARSHQGRGDRA